MNIDYEQRPYEGMKENIVLKIRNDSCIGISVRIQ